MNPSNPIRLLLPAAILLALATATSGPRARAQAPRIADIWPPGGARGATVQARVEGGGLAGLTKVLVSGDGVAAQLGDSKDAGRAPLTLKVAADAQPGPYEVRVIGPKGPSNPAYVWVGAWPEVEEREPDDKVDQPMRLPATPVTVNGRLNAPEDVDWYQLHADAGDTLVCDIVAARLYSPMDPFLELRGPDGRLLDTAMEGSERDPRLVWACKQTGDYRLQVRDTQYRGGPGFVYRLTVGKLPLITSLTPAGGQRGTNFTAQVQGVNLGGMTSLSMHLPLAMPVDRAVWMSVKSPNGPSLPFAVSANDWNPVEQRAGMAPIADNPATVNGALAASGESQAIPFRGTKGQPVEMDVLARDIGSRMMAYARVLDAGGKELLNTEDQIGRDPRIVFTPPATGIYRLDVSSVDRKGGPDYAYRVVFYPSGGPGWDTFAVAPDDVRLAHGQTLPLTVTVARHIGTQRAIPITIAGLPQGVTASPLTLAPDQESGIVTLTTAPNAPLATADVRTMGGAAGTKVQAAAPLAMLPRPGGDGVAPRPVAFQFVTVTDAVPLFTLATEPTEVTLAPGQSVTLKVRAARKPGDNAANPAIALTLTDLPPGVTADSPTIAEKQTEATIKLTAAPNAPVGARSALLTGKLGNTQEYAPAIRITVRK